ncbi:hypothetical protein [Saccharothrix sp. HUAS TT1]|uniref:hypothetical protein n=1 Tax=unclassified Saccharothrix TaxID=2593673 RepID=UPI00345B79EB
MTAVETERADTNLLGDWLEFVARDGYAFLYWPNWKTPDAVVAYREWRGLGITDVISLVHEEFAFGYRALTPQGVDFLHPGHVLYVNEGAKPVHIVRSILTLPQPGHPAAPNVVIPTPPGVSPYFERLGSRRTLRPAGLRQPLPRFMLRPKPEPSHEGSP